jgi:hypothetical protein
MSVMDITEEGAGSGVCPGEVKCDARPHQLITFTRCLCEALPIEYRDLSPASLNQTRPFQLPGGIRDGRPLHTQHFGEQVLRNRERVIVESI